jgi:hypothetical protein
MEAESNVAMLVGLLLLFVICAKFFSRLRLPGCTISGDYETINYGGRLYTFLCCTYSDRQRGELLGHPYPVRPGASIGRICSESVFLCALRDVCEEEYLAIREGGTVDIYQRIHDEPVKKQQKNTCQKHHKAL